MTKPISKEDLQAAALAMSMNFGAPTIMYAHKQMYDAIHKDLNRQMWGKEWWEDVEILGISGQKPNLRDKRYRTGSNVMVFYRLKGEGMVERNDKWIPIKGKEIAMELVQEKLNGRYETTIWWGSEREAVEAWNGKEIITLWRMEV